VQLTDQRYRTEGLCGKRSSNLCFIFFTTTTASPLLGDQVKPLLDIYKKDPVTIVWVDKYEESDLHRQFNESKHHLIAYKPKRARFVGYNKADFSTESLRGWMDDIIGGGGEFSKFEGGELNLKSAYKGDPRDEL